MKLFSSLVLFLLSYLSFSQQDDMENEVFTQVEEPASFPGGEQSMYEFIAQNLRYPKEAQRREIQGKVFVQFIVERDGSITEIKVVKGIGGGCDQETIRIMEMMPKWVPARQKGKEVRQIVLKNISFRLRNTPPIGYKNFSDTLGYYGDPTDFEQLVDIGEIYFDSIESKFISKIDTTSYFSRPADGFYQFAQNFAKVILNDRSYHSLDVEISISFEVNEEGALRNFVLNSEPNANDTAVVRTLMMLDSWRPGFRLGEPTSMRYHLKVLSYLGQIYKDVDNPASEPEDYKRFIQQNLRFPNDARKAGISGEVIFSFIVEKNGSISKGKILEGLGYGCDAEVIRLLSIMPRWNPAIHNGNIVRQKVIRRISFTEH